MDPGCDNSDKQRDRKTDRQKKDRRTDTEREREREVNICQCKEEERQSWMKASTGIVGMLEGREKAQDNARRLCRGPLQSGVLQQVIQTEFSFPVQNC